MEYIVKKIEDASQIDSCNLFQVDYFMWKELVKPVTYGRMGYMEGKGLYIWMKCEESNPKRIYQNHQDPVCNDSAMEAFFTFEEPSPDCQYLNFEFNANGALLANCGEGRNNRQALTEEEMKATEISVTIYDNYWEGSFFLPIKLLQRLHGWDKLSSGQEFHCNFYKISESPEIEHYASFNLIKSETPNFHRPMDFAIARIE